MMYDFDRVISRRNTGSVKFDGIWDQDYPEDILPMWIADMDFPAPACVLDALKQDVDMGIFGYSILPEGFFEALQAWFGRRFGWQVERQWLCQTPGVVYALSAAIRATTQPGDRVLVQTPVYYPFYRVIRDNERVLVENPLIYEDGKYSVDFADFEEKLRSQNVKLFILCSPHNPIGRVWTRQELEKMGSLCKQYGVKVISDEIHCDFAFPEHPHTPFPLACPELAEDTVVCTAPSKSFNLAGMQVSNIWIPGEGLRKAFQHQLEIGCYHGPNRLGMIACRAAYAGGEAWLDACKSYMRENLNYVRSFLESKLPQIRLVEPEGTYFAWLDCRGLGLEPEALDRFFTYKVRILLDGGSMFGPAGGQFQRMVLACPRSTVQEAMQRLYRAVTEA